MSFGWEHFLLLVLKHIPITAVADDYVIIADTPRPRQQLSAITLLRYQNQPVGFSRWRTAEQSRIGAVMQYPVQIWGKQHHQTLGVHAEHEAKGVQCV